MAITAAQVKELRERTGVGMMECKKALLQTDGDIEKAIEEMRKSGMAKAAKKAGRTAAEGTVMIASDGKHASLIEINCETDFVALDTGFIEFAEQVNQTALDNHITDVEALASHTLASGQTVEEVRQVLVTKVGENVQIRRIAHMHSESFIGQYRHGNKIGVLVALTGGSDELAKDIAMHIAASKPQVVSPEDVSEELINKEKEIFSAQAQASGKPAEIIKKMVTGRISKFLNEISLTGQPFVKDPDTTVGKLLLQNNAQVTQFVCYEVGEGIEKKEDNFVSEVMAQAHGTNN